MTPLFIASDQQMDEMVKELISLGADPNYGEILRQRNYRPDKTVGQRCEEEPSPGRFSC
jgi:hypothetical protein